VCAGLIKITFRSSSNRSTTGSLPSSILMEGPAWERAIKDERKSLRHVLHGNIAQLGPARGAGWFHEPGGNILGLRQG
jgi:hypothetical protein